MQDIANHNTVNIDLAINDTIEKATREEFYTNYPFYKYWTASNAPKLLTPDSINIYIHIPFCIQICDYCFYMKELIKSKDQVDEYVDFLCKEIEMVSNQFGLARRPVQSIYIGGGTPSVLTESQFKRLVETLNKYHTIADTEFAFEAEPGTFSKAKLVTYKECGVNRISMGVQSFDDDVIRLSSRKHTAIQAINSINTVKEVGDFVLNIDLLSGLAGETMSTWEGSVDTALAQQIDMLTVYKMKTYANTNFFRDGILKNKIELPDSEMEVSFMDHAFDKIMSAGYKMWSTFAFTKNGSQSKYIEYTWRNKDMIAYGASSFGKLGNLNYQNLNSIPQYFDKIRNNSIPVYRTYQMSFKDMIVKELLLCAVRLRSYRKQEFIDKFGFDYFDLIPAVIDELVHKGYITSRRDELELTRQGILYGDFVSKIIASSVKNVFGHDRIGFSY